MTIEGPIGPPENEGVELWKMPEWAASVVTALSAVDQAFTNLVEDPKLDAYDALPRDERRKMSERFKERSRALAGAIAADTGLMLLQRFVWTESPSLENAPPEERAEFYRPHVEGMKRRVRNLVNALAEGGKKVPEKMIVPTLKGYALLLDTKELTLKRVPMQTHTLLGRTFHTTEPKKAVEASDAAWFFARWDEHLLSQAKGLKPSERATLIQHASMP